MLLLHLVDLCLLLLHDLGKLQLVLELRAEAALRGRLGPRAHHFLVALGGVAILDRRTIRLSLVAHVHAIIVGTNLIGHTQVRLLLLILCLLLVHLD